MTPVLHFSHDEFERRLRKTRLAMERLGIDALIVSDPSNLAWLTGYDGWSFYVHQAVLVGDDGEPLWLGRQQDRAGALRTCHMRPDRIIGYPELYVQSTDHHPMEFLADRLAAFGWGHRRVGVEMDNYWFTAKAYNVLCRHLPGVHWIDATGLVNWQRAVKSPRELDYMRKAARLTERMHGRIREIAEPGVRKCDLAAEIYETGLRYDPTLGIGGDYPAIVPLMPSGKDAAAPHLTWTDEPLSPGEGIFFEIAGVHKRYHCPMSRTIYFGSPPKAIREAEAAVLEGLEAAVSAARAGNRCEDIAASLHGVFRNHGIQKDGRSGYPIGLSYPPDWGERTMSIRPGDRTVLEENMTFHIMPAIWAETWGLEITESIVIGADSGECLAHVDRPLVVKD